MFIHGVLLALLLLGLFIVRGMYQPLYYSDAIYSLLIALIVYLIIHLYYSSLTPNTQRGEGKTSWYLMRGWSMSLTGVLLAALLVGVYAYQFNDGYFDRRMKWEEQLLEKEQLSPKVEDIMLEQKQQYQTYHFEEITILFLGGLSAVIEAVGASLFFRVSSKRSKRAEVA